MILPLADTIPLPSMLSVQVAPESLYDEFLKIFITLGQINETTGAVRSATITVLVT